ncbi:hypothetical protein CHELA20_51156 [Hyphomicrobiales bacterium]|nr:hypothetical protein CHELA41_23856 [Hyphomicrobiales bacterium]CAH1674085.1 hypothetical protein CHELA20_51156 [Hyphomicrobiales bacterium]
MSSTCAPLPFFFAVSLSDFFADFFIFAFAQGWTWFGGLSLSAPAKPAIPGGCSDRKGLFREQIRPTIVPSR